MKRMLIALSEQSLNTHDTLCTIAYVVLLLQDNASFGRASGMSLTTYLLGNIEVCKHSILL
jgi:hypothetical protein